MAIPSILLGAVAVPIVAALLLFLLGRRAERASGWIAFASLLVSSLFLLLVGLQIYGGGSLAELYTWAPIAGLTFGFLADQLSLPVALLVSLVCTAAAVYSLPYMKGRASAVGSSMTVYYVNFLLVVAGLIGVTLSTNLVELYLFVELMLIPTFFVISLFGYVEREKIGIMYFIWNHLGAFIFLAGVILVYVAGGSFEISSMGALKSNELAYWIVGLILVGWLVKMGVFGLHMWLPITEAEPPTAFAPIMAIVSGIGSYVIVRVLVAGIPTIFQSFALPLMVWALITMLYGGVVTLAQSDVKYLYAWSTMSQNAYSLLGIGSFTLLGVTGGVFYFVSHIMGKFVLFSIAGILLMQTGTRDIKQMGGLASRMPVTATIALLGTLILSAVPPTSGFQAEWIMFAGIFRQGVFGATANYAVAFVGIIVTLFTVAYTFWPIRKVFFGPLSSSLRNVSEAPLTMTVPLLAILAVSVIIGIYPDVVFKFLASFGSGLTTLGGAH